MFTSNAFAAMILVLEAVCLPEPFNSIFHKLSEAILLTYDTAGHRDSPAVSLQPILAPPAQVSRSIGSARLYRPQCDQSGPRQVDNRPPANDREVRPRGPRFAE